MEHNQANGYGGNSSSSNTGNAPTAPTYTDPNRKLTAISKTEDDLSKGLDTSSGIKHENRGSTIGGKSNPYGATRKGMTDFYGYDPEELPGGTKWNEHPSDQKKWFKERTGVDFLPKLKDSTVDLKRLDPEVAEQINELAKDFGVKPEELMITSAAEPLIGEFAHSSQSTHYTGRAVDIATKGTGKFRDLVRSAAHAPGSSPINHPANSRVFKNNNKVWAIFEKEGEDKEHIHMEIKKVPEKMPDPKDDPSNKPQPAPKPESIKPPVNSPNPSVKPAQWRGNLEEPVASSSNINISQTKGDVHNINIIGDQFDKAYEEAIA